MAFINKIVEYEPFLVQNVLYKWIFVIFELYFLTFFRILIIMKKVGLIFAMVLLFSAGFATAQKSKVPAKKETGVNKAQKAPDMLKFDCGNTFNWGDVKYAENPLKCTVTLYNVGKEPLKITKVKPGCGCTKQKLDKDMLAPGDSAKLELKLNLKERPGKVTKSVQIFTDDPNKEKYLLFLKANVKTGFKLTPSRISFYNAKIDEESVSKVVLNNTSDTDIVVDSLRIRPNDLIVNGIKKGTVIKPGESVAIEAKYTPRKPGNFHPNILIFTLDHPEIRKIQIYGSGRVREETKPAPTDGQKKGKK